MITYVCLDDIDRFSKSLFAIFLKMSFWFFSCGKKAKQMREEMSNERDSWFASLTKQGKYEIVLFWKVRLSIYFLRIFRFSECDFFPKWFIPFGNEGNKPIHKVKFPTFVIPWKVFSTANTIRRPIFAIHTFRHFGLHVSLLLLQGL